MMAGPGYRSRGVWIAALVSGLILSGCVGAPRTLDPPLSQPAPDRAFETPQYLRIGHPNEGVTIPAIDRTFVFGYADPDGLLLVNGREVDIHHPDGGFLTMIPLSPGDFEIEAVLWLGGERLVATRRVRVREPETASPVRPLTVESVRPRHPRTVRAGDEVQIVAKGSPGMDASFTVEGVRGRFPMAETDSPVAGTYRGTFVVREHHRLEDSRIRVRLVDTDRWWRNRRTHIAEGRITRLDAHQTRVVEVTSPHAVIRADTAVDGATGYTLFPPEGVRLEVAGSRGADLKVRLSDHRIGWIWESETTPLPPGTALPRAAAASLSVTDRGSDAIVRVAVSESVPFAVTPAADGAYVDVSFFGTVSRTDWIIYNTNGEIVSLLEWFQDSSDTYRVRAHTVPGAWWGYDARYEGKTFVLQLRGVPPRESVEQSPLHGLRIAVDAGHGTPDPGARGPTGLLEKDVVLDISYCVADLLASEGATAIMIRAADDIVPLYERPRIAWRYRADILVSIHANALGYAGNPVQRHGYGIYYFHPHSYPLARALQRSFGEELGVGPERPDGLRDDGVRYGNLALARTPQMPAVLVEAAYIIHPREEALLRTEAFQCAVAHAVVQGLRDFAADRRRVLPTVDEMENPAE